MLNKKPKGIIGISMEAKGRTKNEYIFICELLWGGVPVDREWAENTVLFKTSAPIILNKYPLLDNSFYGPKR